MPELPEVERAMRRLRKAVEGKTISSAHALHPALLRQLPEDKAQLLIERRIISVERRGKHQLLHLDDGSMLHANFRMNGDWLLSTTDAEPERFTRALIDLSDGTRIELNDRRALSAMSYHAAGEDPLPKLGMEANDPALDAEYFRNALKSRRGPIKPALMDQKVLAGLGNIYAAEALWRAKISPRASASSLSVARLQRLVDAIREVLTGRNRPPGRYTETRGRNRFGVYDREGDNCTVCGSTVKRIVQAGRSTYYCAKCQRN
jgi:formamidopyrimidine-DNA glycosylase